MLSAKSYVRNDQVVTSTELAQNLEQQRGASCSLKFDDSVLAGFRREYRSHATAIAEKTLAAGASATETILQMAGWIQEMRSQLSRKEFGAFVKELLQWAGNEARPYLDIARTFENFDLARLVNLEPFTIFKLRSKRYAPVVAALREQPLITAKLVHDLISKLPKQSRNKSDAPISGWKQSRSEGTRYYNVILHNEETGLSIEQQAEAEGILPQRVIAEAVALRSQHKTELVQLNEYAAAQLEELQTVVEHARSLDAENRKLMHQLQQQERRIAELEARLSEGVTACWDEVAVACTVRNEYLEDQVTAIAPEHITEYESETTEATENEKPEQEFDYLEPAQENDYLVETEENAQNLEPEPQVFQQGDRVEIVSSRQGAEFVWQIGIVKVANTVGCVVEVLAKTLWFCDDELVLVS